MILDGHNDLALRLWRGEPPSGLHLSRAGEAGFAGGLFALFVPAGGHFDWHDPPYALPPGEEVPHVEAARVTRELIEVVESLDVTIATRASDFAEGRVTAALHLEGAEAVAPDLSDLADWYARGVRSLGLAWARPNAFCSGAPFAFPASADIGPGLTAEGHDLVRACNELGILVDCSHLNERGFWDVADVTDAPLVATHSNAHALCASSRNLTDGQIKAVGQSGGVVGINFATAFLRADGRNDLSTPLTEIVRHLEYVADLAGIEHVAFGSDLEGALVPDGLDGIFGFERILDLLREGGHPESDIAQISHRNWLRVLEQTWSP